MGIIVQDNPQVKQTELNKAPREQSALDDKVQKTAQQYLELCAEYQRLSSAGYVPEDFYQRFTEFTAEEAAVVNDVAYARLTSEKKVQEHLTQSDQYVHLDVPGKGNNCGLYCLAAGIVSGNDPQSLQAVKEEISALPDSQDKREVLAKLGHNRQLLTDRPFQDAFARVLRQVGERTVGPYLKKQGASDAEIRETVPRRGEMAPAEFLLSLASILKMKKVSVWAIGNTGVLQTMGCDRDPELIIAHRGNHYTPHIKVARN